MVHNLHVDGVVQDRSNSCTLAKESLQSRTKPSLYQQVYKKSKTQNKSWPISKSKINHDNNTPALTVHNA